MNRFEIIKRPLDTEKLDRMRDRENKFAFEIDIKANKTEVKQAIEGLFKVKVVDVPRVANPDNPQFPKKAIVLGVGAVLSVVLALTIAMFAELWREPELAIEMLIQQVELAGCDSIGACAPAAGRPPRPGSRHSGRPERDRTGRPGRRVGEEEQGGGAARLLPRRRELRPLHPDGR